MEIKHYSRESKGTFAYEPDGHRLAEMTYTMTGPNRMIIDHTEVDPSLKGQGVGLKLLETLVGYVRENGISVIPLCPYAKAMLTRHNEWHDILGK